MSKISFDLIDKGIIIRGDIRELEENRVSRLFLQAQLEAVFLEREILVPYNGLSPKDLLINVRKNLIEWLGFEEEVQGKAQELLKEVLHEEKAFSIFSEKAKSIKNNECDKNDFKIFQEYCLESIDRKLYPLQLLSAYHLAFSQNVCNFSVPGAGKTCIVLAAYSFLQSKADISKRVNKLLVVGPLSSFGPWEDEYYKCFGKPPKSKRITGGMSKREKDSVFYGKSDAELILISYQGITSVLEQVKFFLQNNEVMMVLDEAHKIKNLSGGIWAQTVLTLSPYCKSRVVLTGTPLPNGYEDLINLYKFIWFNKEIIPYREYQLKQMSKNNRDSRVQNLNRAIDPFYLRITKKDLGLPEPIEHEPIICEMDTKQRDLYDYIEEKYYENSYAESFIRERFRKAKTIRLMQLATNPRLLLKPLDSYYKDLGVEEPVFEGNSQISSLLKDYDSVPTKYTAALQIIKEIIRNKEKVIVWSSFVLNIKEFSMFLIENGIKNKLLYGETPIDREGDLEDVETREKIIKEFHEYDSDFKVIIANPFAAAESISLHKACHNAIYLDRTFNAATFIQSKDRIHRYGLKNDDKINYYYLLSQNSIDGYIHERLKIKEKRMLSIIENHEIPLFTENLGLEPGSDEDIRGLLLDYENRKTNSI